MMTDEDIPTLLNWVWAEFRRVGVTDDLQIVGHIAAYLLEQQGPRFESELPRKPSLSPDFEERGVIELLATASQKASSAAVLFDRYVLFRLPEMLAGGRYPTPRPIVQLMVRLAETAGQPVVDLTCGTGGLLVHSAGTELTGIEISPEWARLARANLALHGKSDRIREGNALHIIKNYEQFAHIVMNPPFGEKMKSEFGTRSETALNAFALSHLSDNGRAVLLAPTGILLGSNRFERKFRQRLVEDHHLEAVVSLPEDAFQPYSGSRTHLLVAHKVYLADNALTWFMRPVFDGYISGRGRDLTTDPQTPNDLTLVELAVIASRQIAQKLENVPFTVQPLQNGEALLGLLVEPTEDAVVVSARYLPKAVTVEQNESALILLEIQQGGTRQVWQCPLDQPLSSTMVEKPEELIVNRLALPKKTKKEEIPRPDLFQNQSMPGGQSLSPDNALGRGVLIKCSPNEKAQLMGVAVSRQSLRAHDFTLDPESYLREPEVRAELRLPHDILRDIHSRQQELAQRMSQLAGWVVPETRSETSLFSPVLDIHPFGQLDATQDRIWQSIAAMTDPFSDDAERQTGKLFTAQDLEQHFDENTVRLALEVFEAMGLIVPVTLKQPQTGEPLSFYRRTQENDAWHRVPSGGGE
jgi:type I restriction enzyme M protein